VGVVAAPDPPPPPFINEGATYGELAQELVRVCRKRLPHLAEAVQARLDENLEDDALAVKLDLEDMLWF